MAECTGDEILSELLYHLNLLLIRACALSHCEKKALGRKKARMFHAYMAKLCADYPGKFGAFAVPTLPDVEGAMEEARYYALDIWELDGVGLLSNYRKKERKQRRKEIWLHSSPLVYQPLR